MIRQGSCCLGLQENKKKACGLKARVLSLELGDATRILFR